MLHYVSMDYFKFFLSFMFVGCSSELVSVQVGGFFGIYLIFTLVLVASPKYTLIRNNVLYTFLEFFTLFMLLCKIISYNLGQCGIASLLDVEMTD